MLHSLLAFGGGIPGGGAFGGGFTLGVCFRGGCTLGVCFSIEDFTAAATDAIILALSRTTGFEAGKLLDATDLPGSKVAAMRLPSCPEDEATPALALLALPLSSGRSSKQ